jgi:CelD/BcsL family acetyltransferase involved in cellulose biosynthesis
MKIDWVTDAAGLAALAPAWAALCDRCPSSSPFERPEWLLPWITVFGSGRAPRVLTIERAGALSAVVPLVEERDGEGARLSFLGSGVSDYHDAVLADRGADLRLAMWRALFARDWSSCVLERLREDSPLVGPMPEGVAARGPGAEGLARIDSEQSEDIPCPVLMMSPGARTAADVLPAGFARRLEGTRRRVERDYRPALRVPRSAADAEELFEGLCALHEARWQLRGAPGVLTDEAVQRFHRAAIRSMWPAGLVRIIGLELAGVLAAVVYGFATHGRMSFYLGAFRPEQASLSPGTLLIALAIERALAERLEQFDFLRGRESYKYRFGAVDRRCFRRTLRRPGSSQR